MQIVLFAALMCYAFISGRELTNGQLWYISFIVLIVCCMIGVFWFLALRKMSVEDKKMVLVAFHISFREFLISIVIFFICDLLLGFMTNAFSEVMLIALMFAYPMIRVALTKPVLEKVYKVK